MKYINLILVITIMMWSCGTTAPTTGETTKSVERSGSITISAKGYGKKEALALNHAKEQAFINLLFRGIPNTSFSNGGMIGNEQSARNKNPDYFKSLFEQNGMDKFIVKTRQVELFSKKNKSVKCDITINTESLRNDLTQNGVISTFGL
tara:strand:- start:375 stop:821 length:447 start_codon:yes stop_codon:yes gene_type:complete